MAEENLGAKFTIDVSSLKAGLAQANRLIKESNSEFKAAAAGLDDWSKSEEGLTAKLKNLNDVADLQAKKVDAMQKEYEDCIANGLDPMSAAAVKMRTDINNEKAALEKTKSEIKKYSDKLDDLKTATKEAGDSTDDASDSFDDFGDSADDASNKVDDLGDSAEKSSDGFTVAKGAIADLVSNGLQKLVSSCKDAISSLLSLPESTREYSEGLNQLETAFGRVGYSAEETYDAFNYFSSVLGDTKKAQETMLMLAQLTEGEKDLTEWTDVLTGVYAMYGKALPTESLTEAILHTAQLGEVQGTLADAIEWAGLNVDDFNAELANCADMSERSAYIQEVLNGVYGEAAETYNTLNKDLLDAATASTDFENAQAKLGDTMRPLTTTITEGKTKILDAFAALADGIDVETISKNIEDAFDTFVDDVLPAIIDGLTWIKDNGDTIVAVLGGIAAGFAAFKVASLIMGVVDAIKAFQLANEGATIAQALLNSTMLANPITWIAVGVAALVAGIILLIKNWDKVKEVAVACWEKISEIWGSVSSWFDENVIQPIVGFFTGLWESITGIFNGIVEWVKTNIKSIILFILNPFAGVFNYFYENCEAFREFIDGIVQAITGFFEKLWTDVSGFFVNLWNDIVNAYHTVIDPWIEIIKRASAWVDENVIQPIVEFFRKLWEDVSGFFQSLWNDIVAIWNVVSGWFNENVIVPITSFFTDLWDGISSAASSAWDAIKGVWNAVSSWFNTNIITPITTAFSKAWETLKSGASKAWEGIKGVFSKVASFFGEIFTKAWEKVKGVFSTGGKIFDGIKDGIVKAFKAVVNQLIKGINRIVAVPFNGLNKILNTLQNIEILGINPFDWITWRAPIPEIPFLAKGGVVKRATTAVIGEDGSEAVVPLERNTEWIDKVADKIASKQKSVIVNQTNNYAQAHSRYEIYKSKQQTAAAVRLALQGG